jgi:hypothetical protein
VNKQLAKNFVTKAEVEALYRNHRDNNIAGFKSLDVNQDGKLTYREVVFSAPGIAKAFTFLDQGRKGYLAQSDFFQRRVVINFKSATSTQKSTSADANIFDSENSPAANSATTILSDTAVEDGVARVDETATEVLPEGVLTWNQWVAAEALSPEGVGGNALAKDECKADQCIDTIVVICGLECSIIGSGGGDGIYIEPTVEINPGLDLGTKPFVFEDLIKQGGKLFCKYSDEPCAQPGWLTRMLAQCATYGSGVQGSCNSAVYTESLANDCRNTKPC